MANGVGWVLKPFISSLEPIRQKRELIPTRPLTNTLEPMHMHARVQTHTHTHYISVKKITKKVCDFNNKTEAGNPVAQPFLTHLIVRHQNIDKNGHSEIREL